MKLRTSHGTYVVTGKRGEILHLPEPLNREHQIVWEGLPRLTASGSLEATVTRGPLAPCTLIVLPDGLVAFRRGRFYLCADARYAALRFDRTAVGPWEQFAIISAAGTVERQHASARDTASDHWQNLQSIPNSTRVAPAASVATFRELEASAFCLNEKEYCYAPVTISFEQLKLFREGVGHFYPAILVNFQNCIISMNKDCNKYVVLADPSCGLIFDKAGFYTNQGFLLNGECPAFAKYEDGRYFVKFAELNKLKKEEISVFVFYDGNYNNYYHWWSDCLVNLEVAHYLLGFMPPVVIFNGRPTLNDWQLASLKMLGAEIVHRNSERSDVIRVKQIYWVDGQNISNMPGYIIRRLSQRFIKNPHENLSVKNKLYVKRKSLRLIRNDLETDKFLLDRGFKIIYNEDYSQEEQIRIFGDANCVVGVHGAGLTNILFLSRGSTVIELMPSAEVRTFYWLMSEKLRHKYGVLICNSVDGHFNSDLEVDLAALSKLIDMMDIHLGFSDMSGDEPLN